MFAGLFSSQFSKECKHHLKSTRARLDLKIKKKKAEVQIIKSDVAKLLSLGHDINAFARMEVLIVNMNQEYCYLELEKYCDDVCHQLKGLDRKRKCPDEAKEAVLTLICAAAWLQLEFYELRKLSRMFIKKFGGCLESFVNSKFVEKMQERMVSDERKIRVLESIALEFSIGFDCKALKWGLDNSPQVEPNRREIESKQEVQRGSVDVAIDCGRLLCGPSRGHKVHPNLPDMDELAARIKALINADGEPVKERSRMSGCTVDPVHMDQARGEEEASRVPVQAVFLLPDPFRGGAKVYPNLPEDFDDLVTRVKALTKT